MSNGTFMNTASSVNARTRVARSLVENAVAAPADTGGKALYRRLIDLSPDAIFVCSDHSLVLLNQAGHRLLAAHDKQDLVGRTIFDFIQPSHHAPLRDILLCATRSSRPTPYLEQTWIRADGGELQVEVAAARLPHNHPAAIQLFVRDIGERKRKDALQAGQNRILNLIAGGTPLATILGEIAAFAESLCADAFCSIAQLRADGHALVEPAGARLSSSCLERIAAVPLAQGQGACSAAVLGDAAVIDSDIARDPRWEAARAPALAAGLATCSSWPARGRSGKILGAFALYRSTAVPASAYELRLGALCGELAGMAIESRRSEEKMRYLAHYDGLTSLPNRFLFGDYLDLAIADARRRQRKCAVLFIDLDKFKQINDTLGHDAGDQVLREVALRLRACLRQGDRIARMGGDEFYVLIEELHDGSHAAEVARKLLDAACRPLRIRDQDCRLSASIGIAVYPEDGVDARTLLENADQAMYGAKRQGRNSYRFHAAVRTASACGRPKAELVEDD
jgi:diguanylate cyclase (GGDEF)-like protein/PAS domain S-box-containing protein